MVGTVEGAIDAACLYVSLSTRMASPGAREFGMLTITLEGRRIDSKEKAIAWLAEIEADRAAGKTAAYTLA
jgi:hypothetical protein